MRTSKFTFLFIVCAAALIASFSASAQQPEPAGLDTPPKLEKLEEGAAPAVTIREPKGRQTVTEKRAPGGKVTEIKVNKGKNTYYLKPNVAPGSTLPGDAQSPLSRPAQWEIYEFNKNKKKKMPDSEADAAPLPPALATPAPTKK